MQKKFIPIATKVPSQFLEKIQNISQKLGLSKYQLLQSMIYSLIRFFDCPTQINDEMYRLIEAYFDAFKSLRNSYNPLLGNEKKLKIRKAILFMGEEKNAQLIEISIDKDGKMMESYNIDTILENILNAMNPNIVRILSKEKNKENHISILMALKDLVMNSTTNNPTVSLEEEVKTLFDDVRITTGEKINDRVYYKRKNNMKEVPIIEKKKHIRADI